MLHDAVLFTIITKNGELVLIAFDSLDQHCNLVDGVKAIVKANQTLREEVDVLLAWHP